LVLLSPDTDFFQAAQALGQSLSQWALLTIGGSLIVVVSTSYYRPKTRRMRLAYLLFLPAWVLLALSIFNGAIIQRSYVAFLVASRGTITPENANKIAQRITRATESQIWYLQWALVCLGVWLFIYLLWWIRSKDY